ncbi:MAG TPA: DUF1569 domain-containing protein [Panacibacter sp.]|nr:DUF1569 domain-containing protein [Panacibacter sp.]HNP44268.1 DUF1569 domain-containing protein [Panacibacter sp.]
MTTILNATDREATLKRFETLQSSTQRLWGTMSAEEMLWHLRSQLELALGITRQTTFVKSTLAFPPVRWLLLYIIPWPKGSRTAPEMNVKKLHPGVKDVLTEKQLLFARLNETLAANELNAHPLFGKMNMTLWGRLIWKHFDHHLRQFGL